MTIRCVPAWDDSPTEYTPDSFWEPWHDFAACRDADIEEFFPPHGKTTISARTRCFTCPVLETCLAFALTTGIRDGVWGGTTERHRRKLIARVHAGESPTVLAATTVAAYPSPAHPRRSHPNIFRDPS